MPMRFPYLKAARVKLQRRQKAYLHSPFVSGQPYLEQFLSFVRSHPVIRPIVAELTLTAQEEYSDPNQLVDVAVKFSSRQ